MSRLNMLLLLCALLSSESYALLITDTIQFNDKLSAHNIFRFDLVEQGYNPATDSISLVTFSYDIKEIVEDPFEDGPDSPDDSREFMIIYDRFLFVRGVFYDVDTGVEAWNLHWVPSGGCLHSEWSEAGEEVCVLQPDVDGRFYSSWEVYTDNLWLNSVSISIDVTRKDVSEPSLLILICLGLAGVAVKRSRQ